MKKFFSTLGKILLYALTTVLVLLLGARLVDGIIFAKFYANSEPVFKIPGLSEGYVPQGFDYDEEQNAFLATGYMYGGEASRVYYIPENGEVRFTQLKTEDGEDYTEHTGGLAHNGEYLYVTGTTGLDVFSYADILAGAEETRQIGVIPTYNDPAYCHVENGYLFAGSYYYPDAYETPQHERCTTPYGDENTSILVLFSLDDTAPFGVNPIPQGVFSTRMAVQGMCLADEGKIVLSTSYGLSASKLFIYDTAIMTREVFTFEGETGNGEPFSFPSTPVYYLDGYCLVETVKAPPMSEEILFLDGKFYVMNESACNKYIFGKFTTGLRVRAYTYLA